jgi:hypothetical protein
MADLPVPVLSLPHWEVVVRPSKFDESLIKSLAECWAIAEKARVVLRGWDYPHIPHEPKCRGHGSNWIAGWCDFRSHIEYWRLYQSGQFAHYFAIREVTPDAIDQIRENTRSHLAWNSSVKIEEIPGFIDITILIYTITEIFEFSARLAETGYWAPKIDIQIKLDKIKDFVLTAELRRLWSDYYSTSDDILNYKTSIEADVLMASAPKCALTAAIWFYERFGWANPAVEILKRDQQELLGRQS